ncbi:hypothetical protein B0J17DRAFT_662658 [Rhizoctonia solani]|nr:hypothetical protein B0J17DRAFT_662658 [Rhizoctonia solani]
MVRESETCLPPPRKIRRTVVEPTTRQLRKRRTNTSSMFVRIPMEILFEIASYLFPIDLISLSRSSKLLRNLLMRRSSRHIWTGAMRNVPGLPLCPSNMSEPHYLALLFTKNCMECGRTIKGRLYEELRVRLCTSCRKICLVTLDELSDDLRTIVHKTSVRGE